MTGLICVSGADASGKSTLAEEIKRQTDGVILHQSYRWKDKMFLYHTAVLRHACHLISQGRCVILDRHWPSEVVYGKVFRGGTKWPHEGRMMDRIILKQAGVYVFALGDPDVIAHRHNEMQQARKEEYSHSIAQVAREYHDLWYGQYYAKPSNYAELVSARGGFAQRADALRYSIERNGSDVPGFAAGVVEKMRARQAMQYQPALNPKFQNVLGHAVSARILFVGDAANPKFHRLWWPFHDYGHSSLFLAQALHTIGFLETDAMWTNVNHPGADDAHVREILEQKHLRVVALGRNAGAGLRKIGVTDFVSVRHPQHAMRFDRGSAAYQKELSDATKF